MKIIHPRLNLKNHVWLMVIRMLDCRSVALPQIVLALPPGPIRDDAEILVAMELVNCAKQALLTAKRRVSNPWIYAADAAAQNDAHLATQLEAYRWCRSYSSGLRAKLHDEERIALRTGLFSERLRDEYSPCGVWFHALGKTVYPIENGAAEWMVDHLREPSRSLAEAEAALEECETGIKVALKFDEKGGEPPTKLTASDIYNAFCDFADSEPALGFKQDYLWWSAASRRLSVRLEKDCRNKGHHLVARFIDGEDGPLWEDDQKVQKGRKITDADIEDAYNEEYVRRNGWYGWNDYTSGVKKPRRHWNLPQLRQLLRRQDMLVDEWFAKRNASGHPFNPGLKITDAQEHSMQVNDAQTRLFWLLRRNNLHQGSIRDWPRVVVFQRAAYGHDRFASVILDYERELISDYPDLIKGARLNEIERQLKRD